MSFITALIKNQEKQTCENMGFNCCNCADSNCGCSYCWSCQACENCKDNEGNENDKPCLMLD